MNKVWKLIRILIFDGVLWLSIYSIFKDNQYKEYGENLLVFMCWFGFVAAWLVIAAKKELMKSNSNIYKEPELIRGYGIWSSVIESLAMATLGMPWIAGAHIFAGMAIHSIRKEMEDHRESDK